MDNKPVASDGGTDSFEPTAHCPEYWPEKVMGFSKCGVTSAPPGVDYDRKPVKTQPYLEHPKEVTTSPKDTSTKEY